MKKLVLGFLFLSVGLVFARFSLFRGSADRVDHTTDANDDNNPDNINEIEVTALHEDDDDKTTALDALSFKSTVVGSSCCKCRNKCPAGPRGEPGACPIITDLPVDSTQCPAGGITLRCPDSLGVFFVCNGLPGEPGPEGAAGPEGSLANCGTLNEIGDTNGEIVLCADGETTTSPAITVAGGLTPGVTITGPLTTTSLTASSGATDLFLCLNSATDLVTQSTTPCNPLTSGSLVPLSSGETDPVALTLAEVGPFSALATTYAIGPSGAVALTDEITPALDEVEYKLNQVAFRAPVAGRIRALHFTVVVRKLASVGLLNILDLDATTNVNFNLTLYRAAPGGSFIPTGLWQDVTIPLPLLVNLNGILTLTVFGHDKVSASNLAALVSVPQGERIVGVIRIRQTTDITGAIVSIPGSASLVTTYSVAAGFLFAAS